MASTNLDALSVKLSHLIDDPVAAATTDGSVVTSSYRTQFLNDGIRNFLNKSILRKDWMAINQYIQDGSATLSSGRALLSAFSGGTPYIIFSARNSTDNVIVRPTNENPVYKDVLNVSLNQYMGASLTEQYYSIEDGYFTLLDGTGSSSDTVYLRYIKEHSDLSVNAAAATVITDTCTTSTTTVSAFTGVISSHVGGRFVGTDTGGHTFDRLITSYVSTTSFTINAAVTDDGATCTGYIIPPSQNDIEIDSQYWDEILQEAYKIYARRYPTQANIARIQVG